LPDQAELLADIRRLTALFGHIGHLRLLGGEPLLNPELLHLLPEFRGLLPHSRISLVTNGLLLEKWGEPLAEMLVHTNTTLCVTCYPCNQEICTRMITQFRTKGVDAILSPLTAFFRLFLHEAGENGFQGCELRHCRLLRHGHLWRCSIAAMISVYNREYHCRYPEENGVDLSAVKDGRQALALLERPGAMCEYCSDNGTLRKWSSGSSCAEDWRADLYKEDKAWQTSF